MAVAAIVTWNCSLTGIMAKKRGVANQPSLLLPGKGGKVKLGKALNNAHHDMPLCTLREVDGSKPARNDESFRNIYAMDAVQKKDDSLVWYRNVSFKQRRVWLASNSGRIQVLAIMAPATA